jgi:hypothetical protein
MRSASTWLLALGLAAPPATWFAAQQASGMATYFACAVAPPLGLAFGLVGLAACLGAGLLAGRTWRTAPDSRFAVRVTGGLAAIFALANLLTLAALALIPPCAR